MTPRATQLSALALAFAFALAGCPARKSSDPPSSAAASSPTAPPQAPSAAPAPRATTRESPETDPSKIAAQLRALRGQPVLVNVFASWCVPCRRELPDIERLQRAHPKLYVLGIAVDEDAGKLREFLPTVPAAVHVVRYPHPGGIGPLLPALHLPRDWNDAVPSGWEETVPLSLAFDAEGAFATGSVGELSPEALEEIGRIAEGAAAP